MDHFALSSAPVIGVVICGRDHHLQFVTEPYISAVEDVGGIPILLPCSSSFRAAATLCHGFLFCGGEDITPQLFGEGLLTTQGHTDLVMDQFHLGLMRYVLTLGRPVLAICRGMQVLNVALGGTIYQDLQLRDTFTFQHMQRSSSRSDTSHPIAITEDSILNQIFRNENISNLYVNSFHHQCIHTLGTDLKATAFASDGVIEAIEYCPDLPPEDISEDSHLLSPFVLGVQWHPECMYTTDSRMRELFRAFIVYSLSFRDRIITYR
jgi:putative glutamine amidotransferase